MTPWVTLMMKKRKRRSRVQHTAPRKIGRKRKTGFTGKGQVRGLDQVFYIQGALYSWFIL